MVESWKSRRQLPRTSGETSPGWYSRGYLPHFDEMDKTQTVTFRLSDSMPQKLLNMWRDELHRWPERERTEEEIRRIEEYLDRGRGSAWLKKPALADMVQNAMLFFDGTRYRLHEWVVMPNHVHAMLTPCEGQELGKILHSWKSYTAHEGNELLGRTGDFWFTESFDRFVRNERHYRKAVSYIEMNPVKAGLCKTPQEWKWSSAYWRRLKSSDREI
jgi:REP element-mobilizing transposase RayT